MTSSKRKNCKGSTKKAKRAAVKPPARAELAAMRVRAGFTQEQLARRLGIEKTAVSHWEQGGSFPKRERIPEVAEILGVTVAELLEAA